jgi:hypothetical protein
MSTSVFLYSFLSHGKTNLDGVGSSAEVKVMSASFFFVSD